MSGEKDIAVLLAAYNGERYIQEQLDSLEKQTARNFVCYIHDDASDDDTTKVVESFCESHPENFTYMGSSKTGGAKQNFMYMLRNVDADYIMFCDQDDVWFPDKIETSYNKMLSLETDRSIPVCVYSKWTVVDENLKIIEETSHEKDEESRCSLSYILFQNIAAGCTMMINRSLRNLATIEDVSDLIYMHDWYVMLLAAACGTITPITESLMYYRQHGDNTVGAHIEKSGLQKLRLLFKVDTWTAEKRTFFENEKMCADAALKTIERYTSEGGNADDESVELISDFLKKQKAPFLIKLLRFYKWKFSHNK